MIIVNKILSFLNIQKIDKFFAWFHLISVVILFTLLIAPKFLNWTLGKEYAEYFLRCTHYGEYEDLYMASSHLLWMTSAYTSLFLMSINEQRRRFDMTKLLLTIPVTLFLSVFILMGNDDSSITEYRTCGDNFSMQGVVMEEGSYEQLTDETSNSKQTIDQ